MAVTCATILGVLVNYLGLQLLHLLYGLDIKFQNVKVLCRQHGREVDVGAAAVGSVGGGERRVSGSGAASPVGEEVAAGEVFFGRSFGGGERYASVSRATIGVAA